MSLTTTGPIVYWNRGNPDTVNGKLQGQPGATLSHDADDYAAYLKMGETWSVPAVAYVGRDMRRPDVPTVRSTETRRKSAGVDFVAYMGSGYGKAGEGTTFYSLDPLTGDVITSVDVNAVATASYPELQRSGMAYDNSIVANPVVFNPSRFLFEHGGVHSPNVAAAPARRVYVGDLWGRMWKFLTAAPDIALPVADLGADQPVATPASLIGFPPNDPNTVPFVYVTTGNDNRATASSTRPFGNFGFMDTGDNTTTAVSPAKSDNGIQVYPPMEMAKDDSGNSSYPVWFEEAFRGTVQPATTYSRDKSGPSGEVLGRVFFAGTRFNAPNSTFAPPVPPFPCRSSFDSILYGLGARTGTAAYSFGAYKIFQDSRIIGTPTQSSPRQPLLAPDEGLSKSGPKEPPPELGLAPTTQATANIVVLSGPGLPQPTVRFGSTICQ
jgi:Tfp pilus tip-associated adhesin PilY1